MLIDATALPTIPGASSSSQEEHVPDLEPYVFEGKELRVILINEEPWFSAADVCSALGHTNPTKAVERLDDDEYMLVGATLISSEGSGPRRNVVSEAGLYSLILTSRLESAKRFKRWITHEVLPAIRRTGGYSSMPQSLPDALRAYAAEVEARELAERRALAAAPKAEAFDTFMGAEGSYPMATVAKMLDTGQNRLYRLLRERGVLISTAGVRFNTPYQRYVEQGWFEVLAGSYRNSAGEEMATFTTRVTPRGVEGLRRLLAGHR